ncbi:MULTISPECIES: murein L,D-transpeptidase [unclassified Pseudoalteromonas]|uniref:L,D-transpeptidase family protein n=1 Tax=unclassified Pseudoalteromonas TaxID=194690 RepID=UPI00160409C1|nr:MULTISPECIES: L,D-transpeptidase family protein [unclassified Pseudoalteromonas]MBB1326182.1 L,D-transpeptidase family protein [Pseudoalteromonas sp. SR45-1]MBB1431607.1 L,D-transpeptidase family protein [Pseudoalteromonas sp. SG43-4]
MKGSFSNQALTKAKGFTLKTALFIGMSGLCSAPTLAANELESVVLANSSLTTYNSQKYVQADDTYYFDQYSAQLIERTEKAINWYQEIVNKGGFTHLYNDELLELGSNNKQVSLLAQRLYQERDLKTNVCDEVICTFDKDIEQAVKQFQSRHGLKVDGRVGKRTFASLNVPAQQKLDKLKLNFYRITNFAGASDEQYVYVNIPEYSLRFVKAGDVKLKNNVIVGKPSWETPAFSDEIEKFVVNPEWRIPTSIATKEIAPKVAEDPDYLVKNNIEIRKNSYLDSQTVNPSNIDWDSIKPYQFDHFLVKRAGEENPLGEVKYLFPNPEAIYVHDTPAKHRFSQANRALSHGCIRIEKPFSLAREIIKHEGEVQTLNNMDSALAQNSTQTFYLDEPLPIHLVYWTAWVDENKLVNFRDDIYQRDKKALFKNDEQSVIAALLKNK